MSEMKWTRDQQNAIEDRGGQLLVSAAAGSGKTAVLVERAVRLLTDPVQPIPADHLLIVTFTNAAAAEMRGRIAERLTELSRQQPGSSALRRQRLLLQRAPICTIDAFCLQLLQKHFSALDIPPDFSTADQAAVFALQQEVLAQVLEEAYKDPDFRAFADLYGRGRSDAQAGRSLLEVYEFLRSLPHPMRALEHFCAQWQGSEPFEETLWAASLLHSARQALDSALRLTAQAIETTGEAPALEKAYRPALQSDLVQLQGLAQRIAAGRWDEAYTIAQSFVFEKLKGLRGYEGDEAERVKALRATVKDIVDELQHNIFVCTTDEFEQDRTQAAPLVLALGRAVRAFDRRYFEAKVQQKVLEFSDFEHLALQLLMAEDGSRTPLAEEISGGYDAVMVDEYQDTNALQDALYRCLARPDGSNLFFVGDLKQSIYRFRQADPAVFLEKQDRFAPLGGGYPAQIALDANFRSAPGVIDAINYYFEVLMDRQLGGVVYGPGQQLRAGQAGAYRGGAELRIVRSGAPAGDAEYIARRIRIMVEEGFAVRNKDGSTRPCTYGDFCILLRARGHFDLYAAALEAEGLPVYADTADDLLDAPHIRPLAALVRVLDNPAQDVYLAAVLLSPLFGFVPDDLVRLRAAFPQGSLYGAVAASTEPGMQGFYQQLAALRRLARTLPADRLLEEILADTGYLAAVGAQENGVRRREDVRQFVAWAAAAAGQGGLSALVRALEAAERSGGLMSTGAGQTRPGCISIMTVHRSKGLEFPVVFVADTARKFNLMDLGRPVLCHAALGLGLVLRAGEEGGTFPTAAHRAVRSTLRAETLSEEMRILYVALTRARDRLILTMPLKDPGSALQKLAPHLAGERPDRYALLHAPGPGLWLLAASAIHPDAKALREQCTAPIHRLLEACPIEFGVEAPPEAGELPEEGSGLPDAVPDAALFERLHRQFAWQYPRAALGQVPAKVSVTAVVHGQQEPTLQRPAFLSSQGMTAAERGTALHAFLQFADFTAAPADVQAEAKRQEALGLLDPALAGQLDLAAVEQFFGSPLFARMQSTRQLLREYDFITALPAADVTHGGGDYGEAQVLVQGVADAVLVWDDRAEILDYKTDRTKDEAALLQAYRGQLLLYARAIAKRLARPVTRCTIYSFGLGREVDVPLEAPGEEIL